MSMGSTDQEVRKARSPHKKLEFCSRSYPMKKSSYNLNKGRIDMEHGLQIIVQQRKNRAVELQADHFKMVLGNHHRRKSSYWNGNITFCRGSWNKNLLDKSL